MGDWSDFALSGTVFIATLPCLVNKLACSKAVISLRRNARFFLLVVKAHRYSNSSASFCILLFLLCQPGQRFCTTYHCTRWANNSKNPCPTSQVSKPCYIHTPILSLYHVHPRPSVYIFYEDSLASVHNAGKSKKKNFASFGGGLYSFQTS